MEQAETFSVKQIADFLQLKASTVYSWAQEHKIPAIKEGHSWRFRKSDLLRWLEQHKCEATDD